MDTSRALEIVRALADGNDPFTSEAFPMDGPYQHPEVVRALFKAVYALQVLRQREKRRESVPLNAGRAWSAPEDAALLLAAEAGTPVVQLAEKHERSPAAIKARLLKLEGIRVSEAGASPEAG